MNIKIILPLISIIVFLTISEYSPHTVSSTEYVDNATCLQCHHITDLHDREGHTECSQCHPGTPQSGNVETAVCIVCHPISEPGICNLTEVHSGASAYDCFSCHNECDQNADNSTITRGAGPGPGGPPATTTVPTSSTHIDICLDCHSPSMLHEQSEHRGCTTCHDGQPRTGNVDSAVCSTCHPTEDPGKCDLANYHDDTTCLSCHTECMEGSTTSTTSILPSEHLGVCLTCHLLGDLHEKIGHTDDCSQCHEGTPQTGNVETAACIVCHPAEDPGKCNLSNSHGASCLSCHFECAPSTTTSSISSSTTTEPPTGHTAACLECHLVDDIHAKDAHDTCTQCHDGTPQEGNVDAGTCIECHPTGDSGKCNLSIHHGFTCLECHTECQESTSTSTVNSSSGGSSGGSSNEPDQPSTHIDICSECHFSNDLHKPDAHSSCNQCHDGTPGDGNVEAVTCSVCHPVSDPGKCNLAAVHGSACSKCHTECADTMVTTTTTQPQPPFMHIDICSECHYASDLHGRDEHSTCSNCHNGSPQTRNVDPAVCGGCHPFGNPGKCGLANIHGTSCRECHFECADDNETTTTTTLSSTTTTTTKELCPITVVLTQDTKKLKILYAFRDTILNRNALGREYINLYYLYAPEVTMMMVLDTDLRRNSALVLGKLLPEIAIILNKGEGTFSSEAQTALAYLFERISDKASPSLKLALTLLKTDIQKVTIINGLLIRK